MGISNALQWWEEWQLRVLLLGSLAFQYFLFITASRHKFPIRSYLRSFIWFVYLGSDALAIYALATLFNRHKKQDVGHTHNNDVLEILWAPILLIHLGGQDSITAYNIEDNELWMRHVLTALSQITVAIYVFCKSWPGGDRRLLQSAILLFVPGILKCLEKPWALNRASINSLVSFDEKVRRTINRQGKQIDSIEDFVRSARGFFCGNDHLEKPSRSADFTPDELFVDLASPCTDNRGLGWSLEGAFDESVLLWHLATDLCFYHISPWCEKSIHHKNAVQCREMSNYMTYLLFVNPEMLMPGTRRNLFTDAYNELKGVVKEKNPPLDERELAERIIAEVQQQLEEITGEDKSPSSKRGLIEDAWSIAEELLKLEDDEKMWRVIEGVWVEMLCFSAARCRGYLHAKGLGTGVEFLSYVWLLLHYMGMETLAEKLARGDLQNRGHSGNLRTFHVRESSGEEQVAGPSTSYANGDNGDQHVVAPFSEDGFTLAGDENV
ncbi:uncharacterized protein [Oryza sativa Japonica Group]|uniref:uncharacterized protein n=1 Tax=Oryza sativa subsp. japonica TaxID=39947 RepID=UPI00339CD0C4